MDEKGNFIVTDVTPAYAQGGGQESDRGLLLLAGKEFAFSDVRFFEGAVKHYIQTGIELLNEGALIEIIVDRNRRKKNSVLHTAGHLIASVAFRSISGLIPTKGHHFSDGSYVELSGELPANPDEIRYQLQNMLNQEIETEKIVSYEMVTPEELKLKCSFIQPGLPADKPLRVVNIEGYFPIGCGGTHIEKLNEISKLTIKKLKAGKGVVRIAYTCFE